MRVLDKYVEFSFLIGGLAKISSFLTSGTAIAFPRNELHSTMQAIVD